MNVPAYTIDLIQLLKEWYPDRYEVDDKRVGTPEYWKHAGVVELIRKLEQESSHKIMKEI